MFKTGHTLETSVHTKRMSACVSDIITVAVNGLNNIYIGVSIDRVHTADKLLNSISVFPHE